MRLPSWIVTALLASACATTATGRPPQPHGPFTVQAELGHRDVLQVGEEYARTHGYALANAREAVQVRPNFWRLRFGLAEKDAGKVLQLDFDGASQAVVHEEVVSQSVP